tara:strand:- start:4355 stop:4570 length:216 start_codon:yes stop_codon:yes gene_type:complete
MATVAELKADLAKYKDARDRILSSGQSVVVDGTTYQEGTLFRIEDAIRDLEHRISIKQRGGFARSAARFRG